MPVKTSGKPTRVPHCPEHSYHTAGCPDCKAYSAFIQRRLRWERRAGISHGQVPSAPVAAHLEMLLGEGNWMVTDLAKVSGVCFGTIHDIRRGIRKTILPITAETLLSIQPREDIRPLQMNLVPAIEVTRLTRGLAAQGWSNRHMGRVMGLSRNTVQSLTQPQEWVQVDTVAKVRAGAAKLHAFDIAQLDKPMPGMDIRVANSAKRKGWLPLAAWRGLDITDPTAVPWSTLPAAGVDVDQDDEPDADTWSYIDPILAHRVADALDTVRKTDREASRRHDGFIPSVGRLTRIEAHALVEYAVSLGLNTYDTARLLGYSMPTKQKEQNAQRSVERMKGAMRAARDLLRRLTAGEQVDPAWCLRLPNGDGFHQFSAVAAALLAVQGEPFGPGWSTAELADRAGVGEEDMRKFLTYATRRGDVAWTAEGGSQPHAVAETSPTDVVPVDLDKVLAAA